MSGTTEGFSRLKIDALPREAFECALPDGTQSDRVLCGRYGHPMAALAAKCQHQPHAART